MEELIKEAERLYQQIDKIQLDLIKSRLDESEGQKAKATDEMETAMCAVFQFLKCILDHKDNIVDLREVWHNVDEEPEGVNNIVIDVYKDRFFNVSSIVYNDMWNSTMSRCAIMRWAYLKDLLPKGGE